MNNSVKLIGGLLAAVLLASANTATAATVILDSNDNVIQVTDLALNFDRDELDGLYIVDFITDVGAFVYGTAGFDFPFAEDRVTAIAQLNNALSNAPIVPTGAGSVGDERYLVPAIEVDIVGGPIVWGSLTGEYFSLTDTWEQCQHDFSDDCLVGITIIQPDNTATFAKFTPQVIPVPAAVWLFGSALGLLGWIRRIKKSKLPI